MLSPSNNKLTEVLEEANELFKDGKCCRIYSPELSGIHQTEHDGPPRTHPSIKSLISISGFCWSLSQLSRGERVERASSGLSGLLLLAEMSEPRTR